MTTSWGRVRSDSRPARRHAGRPASRRVLGPCLLDVAPTGTAGQSIEPRVSTADRRALCQCAKYTRFAVRSDSARVNCTEGRGELPTLPTAISSGTSALINGTPVDLTIQVHHPEGTPVGAHAMPAAQNACIFADTAFTLYQPLSAHTTPTPLHTFRLTHTTLNSR